MTEDARLVMAKRREGLLMSRQYQKLGIFWIAIPLIIGVIWGSIKLWNEFGWYFPFVVCVPLLLFLIGKFGWVQRNTISYKPTRLLKEIFTLLRIILVILLIVWGCRAVRDWWNTPKSASTDQTVEYVARPIEIKEGINYFEKGKSYRYYRDSRKIFVELIEDGTAGLRFQNEEVPTEYWDVEYRCKNNETKTYLHGEPSKNGGYHLMIPTKTVAVKISYEY